MNIKIHNVRLGHANNSSSSHSIVFFPGAQEVLSANGPDSFGWDNFTLTSVTSKAYYLHAILRYTLQDALGGETATLIANELCGVRLEEEDGYGIDHQSAWVLPRDWKGPGIDLEFFRAFQDHLMRADVVVLGGNDNDEEGHPEGGRPVSPAMDLPKECSSEGLVARRDAAYWTLFRRESGAKIRMSFDDTPEPHKATRPELVDLKITDYCPFGCAFCYQGSTREGQHAALDQIDEVLEMLAAWKVFEVAIGGGEPTLHPNFYEVLTKARAHGIVPNFTTKNLAWLHGPLGGSILTTIGSFAFSVDSAVDVERLHEAVKPLERWRHKATVQYILGIDDTMKSYAAVLGAAAEHRFPITLLGYKSTKRGAAFGERKSGNWIKLAMKHKGRLSIDTVLADKFHTELLAAKVPPNLLTRRDGMFSMYIDCVEQALHRSSYETTEPVKLLRKPLWSGSERTEIDVEHAEKVFQGWT